MGKQQVRWERLNWDTEFYQDILNGNGFVIREPATYNIDETKQKSMFGARSPSYGSEYDDETAVIERHRCKCGHVIGKMFDGEECPDCHTKVEARDTNIEFTGWISLGSNYVVNPFYYNKLCGCIGDDTMASIIAAKSVVDVNGHMRLATAEELDEKPKHPYVGIGLIQFRLRFNEIIDYFKIKKKQKADELTRLKREASSVFCSSIPIYSTFLRPQSSTSDTYYYNGIDKEINPLFSLSEKVKNSEEIDKIFILHRIQQRVNNLWDKNFEFIDGKEGWIRGQLLGGPLNFTSRNVIIPDQSLKTNQIDVSYHTFLAVFKFKIIYYLMKMDNMKYSDAHNEWMNAYKFSPRIYEIMQFIIRKEHRKCIINRNPTLNYYSMLRMEIRNVKRDINDYTLSVPPGILAGLNADFDGDILNLIGLQDDIMDYALRKYDPISRMIISRDSGLLNDYFSISKDQLIVLYDFVTCRSH